MVDLCPKEFSIDFRVQVCGRRERDSQVPPNTTCSKQPSCTNPITVRLQALTHGTPNKPSRAGNPKANGVSSHGLTHRSFYSYILRSVNSRVHGCCHSRGSQQMRLQFLAQCLLVIPKTPSFPVSKWFVSKCEGTFLPWNRFYTDDISSLNVRPGISSRNTLSAYF